MQNRVGITLGIVGWVLIGLGIILIFRTYEIEVPFLARISSVIPTIIAGILFLGFKEIILLLEKIVNRLPKQNDEEVEEEKITLDSKVDWIMHGEDRNRVIRKYTKDEIIVTDIVLSPWEDYCSVVLHNKQTNENEYKLLKVGGYEPIQLESSGTKKELNEWFEQQKVNLKN